MPQKSSSTSWLQLLPFWLFIFLFKFAAGLHYTLLPVLGSRILPVWIIGLMIGGASTIQLLFDVPAGFLLDKYGYIRLLTIGTFAFFAGAVILIFPFSTVIYIATIILSIAGWLFFNPGINAYVLSAAPPREGGKYMGIQHAFTSLGIVCAALLLIFIVHSPIIVIGIVLSAIFIAALIALSGTRTNPGSLSEIRARQTSHPHHAYYIRRHWLNKTLQALRNLNPASTILALENLAGAIFYALIWFVVPLVIASQAKAGTLSFGLSVFDLAAVVLGAGLGKLADRYQKKTLIFWGLLIFAVMGLMLGFNLNLIFLLIGFLATAGDEMSSVLLWSWLERIDSSHDSDGIVSGAIVVAEDVGWAIGPIIGGFLFTAVGPSLTIAIGALPIFAVLIFALIFLRGKEYPAAIPRMVLAMADADNLKKPIKHRHKR